MTASLALLPGVAVLPAPGGLQLRAGDERIEVLRCDAPEIAMRVLAMLDGTHDETAIVAAAGDAELVRDLLADLGRRAWLAPPSSGDVAGYLAHFARDGRDPSLSLRGATSSVAGHDPSAGEIAALLGAHGVSVSEAARVSVCVVERPDLALLFDTNDAACREKRPCLFVDLSHGTHATVGPFYVPGEGACYRCFRARLHETTAAYAELVSAESRMLEARAPLPGRGTLPAHRAFVLGAAAAEIVAFFTEHRPLRTLGRAITFDLEALETWSEPVLRVPWCAACR